MNDAILQRFDLKDRTVAITGGGGALCGAMADALGTMGVKVAVLDISQEKAEIRAQAIIRSGGAALAFACDVLDAGSAAGVRREDFHRLGTTRPADQRRRRQRSPGKHFRRIRGTGQGGATAQSFFDLDPAGFRHVFDLNFMGTFLTTQAFSRAMVARGRGSIVNISSMSAFMPLTKVAAYSAAKAAVSNFTQWLAVHFSPCRRARERAWRRVSS